MTTANTHKAKMDRLASIQKMLADAHADMNVKVDITFVDWMLPRGFCIESAKDDPGYWFTDINGVILLADEVQMEFYSADDDIGVHITFDFKRFGHYLGAVRYYFYASEDVEVIRTVTYADVDGVFDD